jgi:NAD(P)-dependent dehydrogenase (short-subunit alcohol dehydrogenase family)
MDILKNKIALITGGTSGMGAATAKRFLAEGATVVVTGSSEASVEAARKEMPGVEVLVSDAGDTQAAKALIDHVQERHNRIDVLFVNAGIARIVPVVEVDEVLFDKIFSVNLRGPYFLIILTSSIGAVKGMPGLSVYSSSKAALHSLGLNLAAELAPRAIRVNTITPGPINTPIHGKMELTAEQMAGMAHMLERIPLRRKGEPEEIASAALYFASDESRFTTGTELRVDGGMTL